MPAVDDATTAAAVSRMLEAFDRYPRARLVAIAALQHQERGEASAAQIRANATYDWERTTQYQGFEWHEVQVGGHELSRLVAAGLLEVVSKSQRHTVYRLADSGATRAALLEVHVEAMAPASSSEPPDDLFDVVIGLDHAKRALHLCLEAERPVHALLVGPPGSGKTLLMAELERLPGARYAIGGNTSRAGLLEVLLAPDPPHYLLIDELEKARAGDLATLLSLMETGRVATMKFGRQEERHLPTRVFAACNATQGLRAELLDRFLQVRIGAYSDEEYCAAIFGVLVRREHVDAELAREIAQLLVRRGCRRVRDAVRIARLCKGDRLLAADLAEQVVA